MKELNIPYYMRDGKVRFYDTFYASIDIQRGCNRWINKETLSKKRNLVEKWSRWRRSRKQSPPHLRDSPRYSKKSL